MCKTGNEIFLKPKQKYNIKQIQNKIFFWTQMHSLTIPKNDKKG